MKTLISKLFNAFGYQIQKNPDRSLNIKEPFYHFRQMLSQIENPIIFDIGAYIGDTVALFNTSFPSKNKDPELGL